MGMLRTRKEWIDPISEQQSLIKQINIDDSQKRMGSVKQVTPQLNMISLIRAQTLWILTAVAGTSISTGKGQAEFPKMEEANLLRSSSLNQPHSWKSNLFESHWVHRNHFYLRTALPELQTLQVQKVIFRSSIILRSHHFYTPARASMPALNSRQVTESYRSSSWSGTASLVLTDCHCLLLVLSLWLLQTDEGFVPGVL